jgi:hypothetical protein
VIAYFTDKNGTFYVSPAAAEIAAERGLPLTDAPTLGAMGTADHATS